MWELGVMMAALPDDSQAQPSTPANQAARTVLPVVLMDFKRIKAAYQSHWQPAVVRAACDKGLQPATLEDIDRLLGYEGIRQDQVRCEDCGHALVRLCRGHIGALRRSLVRCCVGAVELQKRSCLTLTLR